MKNVNIVKVIRTVQIFEKGDLIMFTDKNEDENCYGVVVEDQDPNDTDHVWVRSIKTGRINRLFDVHKEKCGLTPCKFVTHLDKVVIVRD